MIVTSIVAAIARFLGGVRVRWMKWQPDTRPHIYFANHSSHLDFVVLWSALPPEVREAVRPVAGRDYWGRGIVRRLLIGLFRGVLVDRDRICPSKDPLECLTRNLARGRSLVIFPEGTRGSGATIGPFKSGLYYLSLRRPDVELIPVYLENLNRILPKGTILPVPLPASVTFGPPLHLEKRETRRAFLARAREALCELRPLSI
jgi:1-acyl-sn-glycerol-3-phosphate acyltransferase